MYLQFLTQMNTIEFFTKSKTNLKALKNIIFMETFTADFPWPMRKLLCNVVYVFWSNHDSLRDFKD
jgi:hypothetical protein